MPLLRTLLVSVTLLLAGGAALYAATDRFAAFTTEAARRIAVRQHPVDAPGVTLETQSGGQIDFAALRGRWLLVDFIYTRCPTYCTVLGSEFAQLQDLLAGPLARGDLLLVSISFDPAHDTPAELTSYLERAQSRGAGWLATRPVDPDGLARLLRTFGITVIPDRFGGYTHNAAVHVIDPQGRLVAILDAGDPGHVAQTVLESLRS